MANSDEVVVVSVGDTMLGDRASPTLRREGWDYPFRRVGELIGRGDLLVGNLEAPITEHDQLCIPTKRWSYKQEPKSADVYAQIGFNVFDLANNHLLDYGAQGLFDTVHALDRVGIRSFGAGANAQLAGEGVVLEVAGIRIALVGWMQTYRGTKQAGGYATRDRLGVAEWRDSQVHASCSRLGEQSDILIATVHWGKNYEPVTKDQTVMCRKLIDWGADVVNGHHPHVAQGVEIYRGKPILYSLGNFVFGTHGRFAKKDVPGYGLVAAYVIRNMRVSRVELDVIAVDNNRVKYQPIQVEEEEAHLALNTLMPPFNTALRWDGARAVLDLP